MSSLFLKSNVPTPPWLRPARGTFESQRVRAKIADMKAPFPLFKNKPGVGDEESKGAWEGLSGSAGVGDVIFITTAVC